MDESNIVAELAKNAPKPEPSEPAKTPEPPKADYTAKSAGNYEVPELTIYKVMDALGEQYKEGDTEGIDYAKNIYKMTADMIGSYEYLDVAEKIREISRLIGANNSQNQLFRVYQWLRLEGQRKKIEREQEIISG